MQTTDSLTIGDAAKRLGIATSALRFYEQQGLIASTRTSGGQRRFTRDVLRRVSFIRAAQAVGLGLAEIGESLQQLPPERAPTKDDWELIATSWRPRLDAQIHALQSIRDRLTLCIGCGCQSLDSCEVFNPGDIAAERGPGAHFLVPDDA